MIECLEKVMNNHEIWSHVRKFRPTIKMDLLLLSNSNIYVRELRDWMDNNVKGINGMDVVPTLSHNIYGFGWSRSF
jgi:hypothetical protein